MQSQDRSLASRVQGLLQDQLTEVPYLRTPRRLEPDQRPQVLILMGAKGVARLRAPESDLAWPVLCHHREDTEVDGSAAEAHMP